MMLISNLYEQVKESLSSLLLFKKNKTTDIFCGLNTKQVNETAKMQKYNDFAINEAKATVSYSVARKVNASDGHSVQNYISK